MEHYHVGASMRILLTNTFLRDRRGTEMYVHDLALGLLRRGHEPMVFSPELGPVADHLRQTCIRVVDDLGSFHVRPDVLHLHHAAETVASLLRFPGVPAVRVYHDATHWCDEPMPLPGLGAHVAVDHAVRDRVLHAGIPAGVVEVIPNGVDLERFTSRPPLPTEPGRVLVFGNYFADDEILAEVRRGCALAGLTCDVVGGGIGRVESNPERLLQEYDIVVAKARCAREALAVGCAVVTCNPGGLGGLVTAESFDTMQQANFGRRSLTRPVTAELIASELARYDAADAAKVSARMRAEGSLEVMIDRLLDVYERLLPDGTAPTGPDAGYDDVEHVARARVVQRAGADRFAAEINGHRAGLAAVGNADLTRQLADARAGAEAVGAQLAGARSELEARAQQLAGELEALAAQLTATREQARASESVARAVASERDEAVGAVRNIEATRTWRIRRRLLPLAGWLLARRRH